MPPQPDDAEVQEFDFAIVGAGVAGLTLAWQLQESAPTAPAARPGPSPAHPSILLIDGAHDDDALRSLSFWSTAPEQSLLPLPHHAWKKLRLCDGTHEQLVQLADHTYRTMFFADLQREAKRRLQSSGRHRVVEGRLAALTEDAEAVMLTVGGDRYRARWVFDSRFRRADLAIDSRRWHQLWQHIHGWIVVSEHDVFAADTATLLDFRVAPRRRPGTAFVYVLPFGARRALVELVSLGSEPHAQSPQVDAEPLLRDYLQRIYGLTAFTIERREGGVTPMTEQPFARRASARVRRIGIPAGRLKPSTGYALTRILDDNAAIRRSLAEHGHPFAAAPDSRFYRFLDGVLLELWQREPERIPEIFDRLFSRNRADRVLRFLDERASLAELAGLVVSLPFAPFLRALGRWLQRRVRGGLLPPAPRPPAALPPLNGDRS